MKRAIIICVLVVMNSISCKKKETSTNETYSPSCSGTKSFSSDVFPLIKSKCWACHNNMGDYTQVKALSSQIKDNVISGSMPKNDHLTNEQKDIIVCWIEAGAPNN
jgi:hypothetical protein